MAQKDRLEHYREIARRVPGAMALGRKVRRFLDPELRSIAAANKNPSTFQPFPTTSENRYPELFDALAIRLAEVARPRLLSFGCSDGSEVRTLRRWFPTADIVGIDVNARAIDLARRALLRMPDAHVRYEQAGSTDNFPDGYFDAILAMAVFRHGELEAAWPPDCRAILPFSRFDAGVADLDKRLRTGGWLAIWNAHFRFTDTSIASRYEAFALPVTQAKPMALVYGSDNRRIDNAPYAQILFRKMR